MKLSQLAAAAVAFLAGSASEAAQVWTAPAAVKVRPQAQAPQGTAAATAVIAAARNEFESFQVVVTGPATGVSMSLEGLGDGKGHSISGRNVTLYREALINVPQQTGGDGAAGVWPDALVPDVDPIVGEKRNAFPFDVPAGESRAVLVDIHVPADAAAGVYQGTLNVTGGAAAQVPVTLTVWDFALPSTASLRSAFGMTWNGPCMGHGDGGCSNYDAEQKLRARYLQAALDNRISITIPVVSSPIKQDGSGGWGDYDAYAGPFLDGTANTRLSGAKLTAVQIVGDGTRTNVVEAWSDHFKAKGWTKALFNYICDEPPMTCQWSDIDGRIANSRAADPDLPTLVTTTSAEAAAHGISGIDLFVPVVNFMEDRPGTGHAGSQRSKYGATVWWYQSCMSFGCSGVGPGYDYSGGSGWPTYAIDSDATRNRAMEWMSFSYDISGELYYETTQAYFSGDPWVNQINFGGAGDGTLFYPGTSGKIGGQTEIPVESFRMKMIRDGMEDYELLAMARQLGLGDQAKQIAKGVYPTTYQSTTSPAALDSARSQLAQMILHAMGKDSSPAQETTGETSSGSGGTGAVPPIGFEVGAFPGGGCSSSGPQSAWLVLPLFGLLFLRRRRSAE
ncbi:MAG TPA: glycoside hydrolase domain-containing protein [Myxococcales bacterium]